MATTTMDSYKPVPGAALTAPDAMRRNLPALLLLFVGSGCAALIYEIVWYQMLQLVIGLTTVSLGVLLGTFMGGMCLGSLLLPRLISARRHPLRVYAMLELGIGLFGIVVLYALPALARIYSEHFGYGASGMALRIGIAAACLTPPTLLMGATLPAIARYVESDPRGVSWMGFFYGGNIAGAVIGCLLAGFYLLPFYNMLTASFAAVGINVLVAALALLFAGGERFGGAPADSFNASTRAAEARPAPYAGAAYFSIALSGLTALGAEVVWARLLGLELGGTVYTFSIILAIFLLGLGIGSSAGATLGREARNPAMLLGVCQLLLMLAMGWTALMISHSLPYWPIDLTLSKHPVYTFQLDMARVAWAILPAALLWGASFPLALASVARGQDPGRLVGGVYATNTVGAIIGALGFSIFIVPMIGSQNAQRVMIVLAAISALVMFIPQLGAAANSLRGEASPRVAGFFGVLVTVPLAIFLANSVDPAPWGIIAYGRQMATYGNELVPGITKPQDVNRGGGRQIYCVYEGEGLNGSVAVTESSEGVRSFHSAGKVQASNDPLDMKLQRMLGHISALAIKEPKKVLVVACGAGVTAGTFLLHPSVEEITICDIEGLVPTKVTPQFDKENYGITTGVKGDEVRIVHGKKVRVVNDDGRHFIRTSKEKFDIISSDPIDPWVKGCAALNTVEYYTMCKEHLNPGGVMSLWIPLYESNLATTKSVIGTFFKVFDKGILWSNDNQGEGYDAVLFGQPDGSHFNVDEMQKQLDGLPEVSQSLAEVGFHSANDLLTEFAAYAPDMQKWMGDAQINNDRDMRLQYLAGMYLNTYASGDILRDITQYRKLPEGLFSGSPESLEKLNAGMK